MKKELIKKNIEALHSAIGNVSEIWLNSWGNEVFEEDYPFSQSLDEIHSAVGVWKEKVLSKLETESIGKMKLYFVKLVEEVSHLDYTESCVIVAPNKATAWSYFKADNEIANYGYNYTITEIGVSSLSISQPQLICHNFHGV